MGEAQTPHFNDFGILGRVQTPQAFPTDSLAFTLGSFGDGSRNAQTRHFSTESQPTNGFQEKFFCHGEPGTRIADFYGFDSNL